MLQAAQRHPCRVGKGVLESSDSRSNKFSSSSGVNQEVGPGGGSKEVGPGGGGTRSSNPQCLFLLFRQVFFDTCQKPAHSLNGFTISDHNIFQDFVQCTFDLDFKLIW